jgi:hypothetical protein
MVELQMGLHLIAFVNAQQNLKAKIVKHHLLVQMEQMETHARTVGAQQEQLEPVDVTVLIITLEIIARPHLLA